MNAKLVPDHNTRIRRFRALSEAQRATAIVRRYDRQGLCQSCGNPRPLNSAFCERCMKEAAVCDPDLLFAQPVSQTDGASTSGGFWCVAATIALLGFIAGAIFGPWLLAHLPHWLGGIP